MLWVPIHAKREWGIRAVLEPLLVNQCMGYPLLLLQPLPKGVAMMHHHQHGGDEQNAPCKAARLLMKFWAEVHLL